MSGGGWFDAEALEAERMDADLEQADFEAAGREYGRRLRQSRRLLAAGDLGGAAAACPHGSGYPLRSLAARNLGDPRAGEDGFRCSDCGSVLAGVGLARRGERPRVLAACDWRRA